MATYNIKQLKDSKNGTPFFPKTHTKAVVDDNGNSVESVLQAQTDLINQAQMEVGSVPSDLTPTSGSTNWVTSGGVYNALEPVKEDLYYKKADAETISTSTLTFTQSKYIDIDNGNVKSGGTSWYCTEGYTAIDNWLSVYTTATGSSGVAAVAFYDENKTYLANASAPCGTTATVAVPENAAFARFSKSSGSHTITTYTLTSRIEKVEDDVDAVKADLVNNYQKKAGDMDLTSLAIAGKAARATAIGADVVIGSYSSFRYIKYPCQKGDIFGIVATGHTNAYPIVVTDADGKVLYYFYASSKTVGGVFEVGQDNAAYIYISSNGAFGKAVKLNITHDDVVYADTSYAKAGMYAITGNVNSYTNYVGIAIPMLLKKGDVAKIRCASNANYRGYVLSNLQGTLIGGFGDSGFNMQTFNYVWGGDETVYLHVNGSSSYPPFIQKFSTAISIAMKNSGRKMVALGDSITSYAASSMGELVRGAINAPWCVTSSNPNWGNLAEGEATICNWESTQESFIWDDETMVNNVRVNRTLPNEVLKLLQHVTAEGEQITWTINSDNSTHSVDTTVATGTGYTTDTPSIIYISMGTNDSNTTDDFDTVMAQSYSSLTKLTICSSLRWCLETLQNRFPNAVIVCVTPIKRGTRSVAEMEAKCALIKKVCNYMAIPVIDGYNISGFNRYTYSIYSSDQIHPNNYTGRLARSIAAQVDSYI